MRVDTSKGRYFLIYRNQHTLLKCYEKIRRKKTRLYPCEILNIINFGRKIETEPSRIINNNVKRKIFA